VKRKRSKRPFSSKAKVIVDAIIERDQSTHFGTEKIIEEVKKKFFKRVKRDVSNRKQQITEEKK